MRESVCPHRSIFVILFTSMSGEPSSNPFLRPSTLREQRPANDVLPVEQEAADPQVALKAILKDIDVTIQKMPLRTMWFAVTKRLLRLQRNVDRLDPQVAAFLQDHIYTMLDVLHDQIAWKNRTMDAIPEHQDQVRSVAGQEALHHIADDLSEAHERKDIRVHRIGWDEILKDKKHFEMEMRVLESGDEVKVLKMRVAEGESWHEFIVPPNEKMMHKGGASRILLKIMAGAPIDLLISELPVNDVDAVGCGEKTEIQRLGLMMGADIEGIEMVENFENMPQLLADRDMDMNQAFMTNEGLVFTEEAMRAARTGKIKLSGGNRGIYGTEVLFYQKQELAKNRGLYRLMKMVVEGKAREFDYKPLNNKIDLGIYWLVLARKFAKKKNAGALLRRFYQLGKEMGQIREGEQDIYDVLDRVHAKCSFFRFDEAKMDEAGHIRWLTRKLFKVVERAFRMERGIPSGLTLEREPFDTIEFTPSLFRDQPDPTEEAVLAAEWKGFEERCRIRSDAQEMQETKDQSIAA